MTDLGLRFNTNSFQTKYKAFQFHYGSIKMIQVLGLLINRHHFNSTMVRLEYKDVKNIQQFYTFQFHYGSIRI